MSHENQLTAVFQEHLAEHLQCLQALRSMAPDIAKAGLSLARTLERGCKILVCGNGGSAADAQHFAAEIMGRFEHERGAWASLALTTDTSALTAIGNDYGFDMVFARQLQGLGRAGDMLVGISTSGESANVIKAFEMAASMNIVTIALLGKSGGRLAKLAGQAIVVPHGRTARIQEGHGLILHAWAGMIEASRVLQKTI